MSVDRRSYGGNCRTKYVAKCHSGNICGSYRGRTVKSKPQGSSTINGTECGTSVRWYSRICARTSTHGKLRPAAGAMTAARTSAQWGQRAIARSIEYSMTAVVCIQVEAHACRMHMCMVHEKGKMDYGSSRMSWGGILCIMRMQHGIPSSRSKKRLSPAYG
jgi:hypothetical protein